MGATGWPVVIGSAYRPVAASGVRPREATSSGSRLSETRSALSELRPMGSDRTRRFLRIFNAIQDTGSQDNDSEDTSHGEDLCTRHDRPGFRNRRYDPNRERVAVRICPTSIGARQGRRAPWSGSEQIGFDPDQWFARCSDRPWRSNASPYPSPSVCARRLVQTPPRAMGKRVSRLPGCFACSTSELLEQAECDGTDSRSMQLRRRIGQLTQYTRRVRDLLRVFCNFDKASQVRNRGGGIAEFAIEQTALVQLIG
jgi:hypothetical protein